jgi:hypothetical protein
MLSPLSLRPFSRNRKLSLEGLDTQELLFNRGLCVLGVLGTASAFLLQGFPSRSRPAPHLFGLAALQQDPLPIETPVSASCTGVSAYCMQGGGSRDKRGAAPYVPPPAAAVPLPACAVPGLPSILAERAPW